MESSDLDLAIELIQRLNALIQVDDVRDCLGRLLETRIPVSQVVAEHPTIQVVGDPAHVGLLGLLNGLVGVLPNGLGYISASMDGESGALMHFQLTDSGE